MGLVAQSARWLDADAIDIAKDPVYSRRFQQFVDQYVRPESCQVEGDEFRYCYVGAISDLAVGGLMLNVRMRQSKYGEKFDPDRQYVVASGRLDSGDIEDFRPVPFRRIRTSNGQFHVELLLDGDWSDTIKDLPLDPTLSDLSLVEAMVQRERAQKQRTEKTTRLITTSKGRWLHQPDHVVHRLNDLPSTMQRVELARTIGFGRSAFGEYGVGEA